MTFLGPLRWLMQPNERVAPMPTTSELLNCHSFFFLSGPLLEDDGILHRGNEPLHPLFWQKE